MCGNTQFEILAQTEFVIIKLASITFSSSNSRAIFLYQNVKNHYPFLFMTSINETFIISSRQNPTLAIYFQRTFLRPPFILSKPDSS